MLDAGLNSPFIPECSPIPLRHGVALYSSSEVAGPIPDTKIGPQQMSITLNPVEPDIEITAREARDLEETERIHERGLKVHLKQPETDHQTEDEREHFEELKKPEEGIDRQSELERLRVAARAVEMANRLTEGDMVELEWKIVAGTEDRSRPPSPLDILQESPGSTKDWFRSFPRRSNVLSSASSSPSPSPSVDDYESILSNLVNDIRKRQLKLSEIRLRERRSTLLTTLYTLGAWVAYVSVWYFDSLPSVKTSSFGVAKRMKVVPVIFGPVVYVHPSFLSSFT